MGVRDDIVYGTSVVYRWDGWMSWMEAESGALRPRGGRMKCLGGLS